MNHILNDEGKTVIAVGAPGSQARVKVQYPKLVAALAARVASECTPDVRTDAFLSSLANDIEKAGVKGPSLDMTSILGAAFELAEEVRLTAAAV